MELHQLKLQDPFDTGINLRNVQHLIVLPNISRFSTQVYKTNVENSEGEH